MLATDNFQPVSRDFWENDLQMDLDPWLARAADDSHMRRWINGLNKRCLGILQTSLGLNAGGKLQEQRDELLSCDGHITPYFLVDRFAYKRSKFATADYARSVLPDEIADACKVGDDNYDTTALLLALFQIDPNHLITVFHLEKVHTTGFARMKLKGNARKPNTTFKQFLTPPVVQQALARFDTDHSDGRTSEFKNIVDHAGHHLVFIRREEKRSMLLRAGRTIHAFKPEWIVLDFRNNGKGVDIASTGMTVPLQIANRIVSLYFGGTREYENEVQVTYGSQILKFLTALAHDECEFLKLAEVHVRNSPIEGAPILRISSEDGESIAESVRHFENAVGPVLDDVDLIKAVKAVYCGKRVKLTFEPVGDVQDGYVVRYADGALNAPQRRGFEQDVCGEPYGIRALSTEKRHKK